MEQTPEYKLTSYERRLWVEVDRILYQNYLTPRTVTDFWRDDRDAVIWHLKQMKDRVIRTVVIMRYVELDDLLNHTILKHLLKRGSRTNNKRRTVIAMLDRLYPIQKIDIVKTFLKVPATICDHIMALNTIRNSFAHRFDLKEIPKSKRLYKGKHDLFTKKGLKKFEDDMFEIDEFFRPEIVKVSLDLVRWQKQRNKSEQSRRRVARDGKED